MFLKTDPVRPRSSFPSIEVSMRETPKNLPRLDGVPTTVEPDPQGKLYRGGH